MKKLVTIFLLTLSAHFLLSQNLQVKSYVEYTIVSPKAGTALGMITDTGYEYGAFYQEASFFDQLTGHDSKPKPRFYEEEFFGLYAAAAVVQRDLFDVKLQVRTGVTNRENFVITPSVLSELKVGDKIKLGFGLGVRTFNPTYQFSLALKLR